MGTAVHTTKTNGVSTKQFYFRNWKCNYKEFRVSMVINEIVIPKCFIFLFNIYFTVYIFHSLLGI